MVHKKISNIKLPVIDFLKCKKCNKCIEACPNNAIIEPLNTSCSKCIKYCILMEVPCSPKNLIFDYELCDTCGLCIKACPDKAIYWYLPKNTSIDG